MDGEFVTLLTQLLQVISAALIGLCLFVIKSLFRRIKELEERQYSDRLELERRIQEVRMETTKSITRLETLSQTHYASQQNNQV